MPVNKTFATKRGKAAVAAAIMAAALTGWQGFRDNNPAKHVYPPAVILATEALIKPWEGNVPSAHWDPFAKIYDIRYGKTRRQRQACHQWHEVHQGRVRRLPRGGSLQRLLSAARQEDPPGFTSFLIGNQAAMISGAYNFGVGAMVNSTATSLALKGQWEAACDACRPPLTSAGGACAWLP
ncbi:glycoside hydrolase (plasmid) [Rhizobium beringeri]|uniref:glycoside hydrolase family protein n=1 Tax=Rhizobium beringeri TaxID=3019934 RepID=UPI002DDC9CCC|nr:glycoside hydrolase [Rhizobium beringeri]WSG93507.1 glycoside hydrolase [Rhizobium beringeri]